MDEINTLSPGLTETHHVGGGHLAEVRCIWKEGSYARFRKSGWSSQEPLWF